jgi:hypothetical protein
MRKITVTEGLNELKLYDSKIEKAIDNLKLIGAKKKSVDKVGVVNVEKFVVDAKAAHQSIMDLIRNRNTLKAAIVKSNAITYLEIGDKTMTVAEAIERKNSIQYEKDLLLAMKAQYASATVTVNKENTKVDNKVDELIQSFVSRDTTKKFDKNEQTAVEALYREQNEWELVDPLNLFDLMTKLEADIDTFESQVDGKLSLCNATTFIELDF